MGYMSLHQWKTSTYLLIVTSGWIGGEYQNGKGKCFEKGHPYESAWKVICETFFRQPSTSQMTWWLWGSLHPPPPSPPIPINWHHQGLLSASWWKYGWVSDQKKQRVAAEIMGKWGERIWVMGSYVCVSWKYRFLLHLMNWPNHSISYT